MTRITFPYLFFITLATLHSGTLNAHGRFAAAAFAPVLLNLSRSSDSSPSPSFSQRRRGGELGRRRLGRGATRRWWRTRRVGDACWRRSAWPRLERRRDASSSRALAPAIIGSAGVQIAILADTIIASLLPTGVVSSIYYAERLYQLPIGVIGVAAGTVLLPEMSRRLAAGDAGGAFFAQNRTMAITLALSAPFCVAFLLMPDLVTRAAFLRGAFSEQAAASSAAVLAAYGLGLLPIVLIRSAVASFQARGDTATPMFISLGAIAVNVGLKVALYRTYGAVGLALATAVGAWVNLGALSVLALRRGWMRPDLALAEVAAAAFCASGLLALAFALAEAPALAWAEGLAHLRNEAQLAVLGAIGGVVYGAVLVAGLKALGVSFKRRKT